MYACISYSQFNKIFLLSQIPHFSIFIFF